MRITRLGVVAAVAAGCAAELPPTPEECAATVLHLRSVVAFEPRVRVLVLLDERTPLPDDVPARLAALEEQLRTSDIQGDGTADFPPFHEVGYVVQPYDAGASLVDAVAPHVPAGFAANATRVALVIVTADDVTYAHAAEAASLIASFDEPDTLRFVGVSPTPAGSTLAQLAEGIAALGGVAETVALDDPEWERAVLRVVVDSVAYGHPSGCLARALERDADGRVGCTLTETLHPEAPQRCDALPGRVPAGTGELRRCRIAQVVSLDGTVPTEPGWYYDDASPDTRDRCGDHSTLRLTPDVEPVEGSQLKVTCVSETGSCTL